MKRNTCLLVWIGAFLLSVLFRTAEMLKFTEYDTGFIIPSYKTLTTVFSAAIFLFIAFSAFFISKSTRTNACRKGFNSLTSLSAFMLGAALAVSAIADNYVGVPSVLRILCTALAVLSAVYFIAFALRSWVHFPFSAYFSAVPALFFVARAASVAIKGAYHTVISDTVFDVAAYCFIMLFFLEFVRAANGSAQSGGAVKFAAMGTLASLLSLTASTPKIIISVFSPEALHDGSKSEYLLFFVGIYIACEVFSRLCFKQETSKKFSLYYSGKH